MQKILYIWGFSVWMSVAVLSAQTDSTEDVNPFRFTVKEDILNLPVEGLQDKKVYSVSQKIENWVNTPLSVEVITYDEIIRSGALNIPEALRLAPGLIVRQRTNGTYDVHIRGMDNISQDGYLRDAQSQALLVMVDEVPFYDYLQGTVFWESLPADIHDVERIEIIKTPHQALFGTNAAAGFIHIITKKVDEKGLKADVSLEGGTQTTAINKAALSYGVTDRLRFRVSGNYHFANRFQDELYLLNEDRYIKTDSLLFYKINAENTNINTKLGNQQYGLQLLGIWDLNNNIQMQGIFANQNSRAQTVFVDDTLAMASRTSNTNMLNFLSSIYNGHVQLSYRFGSQDNAVGFPGMKFDITHFKINADYTFRYKTLNIKPGVQFQRIAYDDTPYLNASVFPTVFNRKVALTDIAAYFQLDWSFQDKWRVLAGLRNDKYNALKSSYVSYQLAASYRIDNNHLVRFSSGGGNQSPLLNDFYNNSQEIFSTDGAIRQRFREDDLKLRKISSIELGYRAKFLQNFETDLEVFYLASSNYLFDRLETNDEGEKIVTRSNSDLKARQFGVNFQVQAIISKILIRSFMTLQYSRLLSWINADNLATNLTHKATPNVYGGFELNYSTLFNRLNINTNIYFFDNQEFINRYGKDTIKSKLILNLKVSYNFWKANEVYLNLRNLPGFSGREFVYADEISGLYMAGVHFRF
ncbi:MAG: TonB-dependent receptor [Microscillaceae bacterium]|nr:TonB-dependent receptor [Microscillaceae bacterium]